MICILGSLTQATIIILYNGMKPFKNYLFEWDLCCYIYIYIFYTIFSLADGYGCRLELIYDISAFWEIQVSSMQAASSV